MLTAPSAAAGEATSASPRTAALAVAPTTLRNVLSIALSPWHDPGPLWCPYPRCGSLADQLFELQQTTMTTVRIRMRQNGWPCQRAEDESGSAGSDDEKRATSRISQRQGAPVRRTA